MCKICYAHLQNAVLRAYVTAYYLNGRDKVSYHSSIGASLRKLTICIIRCGIERMLR